MEINVIVSIVVSVMAGAVITYIIFKLGLNRKSKKIVEEAQAEAEMIKKDKILQAKEKFLQLKSEHEKIINEKNSNIAISENKLKQKESTISQKIEEANRKNKEVDAIRDNLNAQIG